MKIKVIETVVGIRDEWEKLLWESDTATVFQSPNWVGLWDKKLVLGVYDGNELVGIGAFEQENDKVRFVGMRQNLADFGDIVAQRHREKEIWLEILKYLRSQITDHRIELDFIRETSPSFGILEKIGKVKEQEVSPYIKIPRSWDIYLQSLPRKKRHELRRKMKKIDTELVIIEKSSSKDEDRFIELMRNSSEEKRRFMDKGMEEFFRKIIKLGKLFSVPDAMVLGFEWRKDWYLYNSGSSGGRGIALFGMIIREAIKLKIERLDFLRGGEKYKYDLGAKDEQLYNITYD